MTDLIYKKEKTHRSFPLLLTKFIILYSLFAPSRIKILFSIKIDGNNTNNLLIILPILYLFSLIIIKKKVIYKSQRFLLITISILIVYFLIGGYKSSHYNQFWYALLIFLVPIPLYFFASLLKDYEKIELIKFLSVINILYSIIAILLVSNYGLVMRIFGNAADNYRYYSQYRASMMLGSSITVSYYMNLALPLNFYVFLKAKSKKWNRIGLIAIVFNILTTVILLSRSAFFVSLFIITYFVFFNSDLKHIKNKIFIIIIIFGVSIFVIQNYEIGRIFIGFDSSNSSFSTRVGASMLGIEIFKKNPLFGSGIGKYFVRSYNNREILVDGVMGLVDPHNTFVQILSETGLFGLSLFASLFTNIYIGFGKHNKQKMAQVAKITLISYFLVSLGGTHLFNEISFSSILWIYFGLFTEGNRRTYEDSIYSL